MPCACPVSQILALRASQYQHLDYEVKWVARDALAKGWPLRMAMG